jgi:hypothetical protein
MVSIGSNHLTYQLGAGVTQDIFDGSGCMKPERLLALLGMFFLLLNLTLLPPVESQASETHRIEIHSFMPGTTTYVMGVVLADQINKHSTWRKETNVATKGF